MKAIQIKTVKVVGQTDLGESKFETTIQKIIEGKSFDKFLKYLSSQGYKSVTVVNVVDVNPDETKRKEIKEKELTLLIGEYQGKIDAILKPVKQLDSKIDPKVSKELEETKSALQKQLEINEANDKRLKELEAKLAGLK